MATVLQPLKPNQQNQRMKTPRAAAVRLCPGIARALPSFSIFSNTGSKHLGADAGGHAAYHMDCGASCEIMKAQSGKPAAAPDPVTGDGIYHEGDQCTVCAVCFEIGTLCHGPDTMVAAVAQNTVWKIT